VIGGRYSIISDRIPIKMSPQMIQSMHQISLINLLHVISCGETAFVLAVTCPLWSWGGKEEEGGVKMEKGEGAWILTLPGPGHQGG
jgi:hypothetical protein